MLFLMRYFGVTPNGGDRILGAEQALHEEIVEKVLLLQANTAAKAHCTLSRGTHKKGVSVRAQFEVLDVTVGRAGLLADRLAQGMFAKPGVYPAIVRFANSDPNSNSDFKADVRAMSFSVDLTRNGTAVPPVKVDRQDFSLQNAATLPINDAPAFMAMMKVLTASNPGAGLWSLPFKDKLRVLRTLTLVQFQSHKTVRPYQQLRYWSTVPFRHGPVEVVKQSATPSSHNHASPLQRRNPNALQDELIRHVDEHLSDDFMLRGNSLGRCKQARPVWGIRSKALRQPPARQNNWSRLAFIPTRFNPFSCDRRSPLGPWATPDPFLVLALPPVLV